MTQLEEARENKITKEMEYASKYENLDVEVLRERMADGKIVILANQYHENLNPVGIGYGLRTKVNANIGISPIKSDLENELKKLKIAIDAGTDTVMDLSIGENLDEIRRKIIESSRIPVGTVPIYQAVYEIKNPEELTLKKYLEVFEKHASDGIDFATVHAGVIQKALSFLEGRLMPCVSRGGKFMIDWMTKNKKESFLFEHFEEILDIAKEYDVTLSLGDALRPGSIADATDKAQIAELYTLGYLAEKCKDKGVQVMIEGPGHIPLNEIEKNVSLEKKICNHAPFYVLGPLPTDIAAGYDHIACAIGGALAAWHGADFLCYVTPKEHIGLPDAEDVREGVTAMRIAAHIGDIAKGLRQPKERDIEMSKARANLDWDKMREHVIDPERFKELLEEECEDNPEISKYCSMCGPFCTEKKKEEKK